MLYFSTTDQNANFLLLPLLHHAPSLQMSNTIKKWGRFSTWHPMKLARIPFHLSKPPKLSFFIVLSLEFLKPDPGCLATLSFAKLKTKTPILWYFTNNSNVLNMILKHTIKSYQLFIYLFSCSPLVSYLIAVSVSAYVLETSHHCHVKHWSSDFLLKIVSIITWYNPICNAKQDTGSDTIMHIFRQFEQAKLLSA